MKNGRIWNTPAAKILEKLEATPHGLTNAEAARRLDVHGPNRLKPKKKSGSFAILLGQFKSPIILILIFAGLLSIFVHDHPDASIILIIVGISGILGF